MSKSAEYIIYNISENGRQGHEIARHTVSTYKWGPGNAFEAFCRTLPEPGKYLVTGPGSPSDKIVWCIYEVARPDYVIKGIGASANNWELRNFPKEEV